jgi:two-component system sensor histidine kinase KdpD
MDGMLIEQVLLNLLENVLRHTPLGSPIEVAVTESEDSIRIEVADRGPGIAVDALERIFEKFHSTAAAGGSGLGLAICRAIVSLHGGRITAANREGGGAVFTVSLPLQPPPALPPLLLASSSGGKS